MSRIFHAYSNKRQMSIYLNFVIFCHFLKNLCTIYIRGISQMAHNHDITHMAYQSHEEVREMINTHVTWDVLDRDVDMFEFHPFGATMLLFNTQSRKIFVPIEGPRWLDIYRAGIEAMYKAGPGHFFSSITRIMETREDNLIEMTASH